MKDTKRQVCILIVMLSLLMSACGATSTVYTVEKNHVSYEVNIENQTISDGANVYQYDFSGNKSSYDVNITYPDGSTYWFHMSDGSGYGGWSDDYDENRYVDGDTLSDVLLEKAPKEVKSGNVLAALIIAVVGIFYIASPYTAWYLGYGWRYKNAEPSDSALGANRVVGVIAVVAAVILLFV
ncbi:MAG: hypothetical protein IJZ84_01500 [Lachnospiraceae bacterium]|nr:hypothetical protein [Lachnospiraceae bacterium]